MVSNSTTSRRKRKLSKQLTETMANLPKVYVVFGKPTNQITAIDKVLGAMKENIKHDVRTDHLPEAHFLPQRRAKGIPAIRTKVDIQELW